MKTQFRKTIIGISLAVMYACVCSAQNILGQRDSLPVLKPRPLFKQYRVKHQGVQEYSISAKKPKRVEVPPKKTSGSLMGGAITLFTGLNTSSSTKGLWMMPAELTGEGNSPSWKMPLYFQGTFMKDRERIKNDDGSSSLEVVKALDIDWEQESYGFIFENSDTIGYFTLVTNLLEDTASQRWLSKLEREGSRAVKRLKLFTIGQGHDYKISLAFRGRPFTILSNDNFFRTLILIDGRPVATFQSEPNSVVLGKANRLNPYILFTKGVSDADKSDLLRLSLLSSLIRNIVSEDLHEM